MYTNGLWVTTMCQCEFISYNKYTSLVGDVDKGEAMHVWGQGVRQKSLCLSLSFAVHLKLL